MQSLCIAEYCKFKSCHDKDNDIHVHVILFHCHFAHISRATWVKVFGTTYKKLCAVVIGTSSGIHPQFGSIEDIFVNDEEVLFSVKKYTTLYYSEHFNSFVVQKTSELCTVYQRELYHYIPLHVRTIQGLTTGTEQAVVLKTHVSTL